MKGVLCQNCLTYNSTDSQSCHKCGEILKDTADTVTIDSEYSTPPLLEVQFNPGDILAGRYIVIEEIGRGGMGQVYKVKDRVLGITVALKLIHPQHSDDPEFKRLLKNETLLSRAINHENVIRVHDLGEIDKLIYISMDYIKGETLRELIRTSGTLTVPSAVRIAKQIGRALKAAHQKGIIHRDLNSQNIMLDRSGHVYIMDFGISTTITAPDFGDRKIIGTPAYLSPEQAKGKKGDERSDIYSFGMILYEMLTGRLPFESTSKKELLEFQRTKKPPPPSRFNLNIPAALEKIILLCLEKKPERRFQTAEDILEALEHIRKRSKKGRNLIVAAGVTGAALAAVVMILSWNSLKAFPYPSVGILPFENLSGREELAGLCKSCLHYQINDLRQSNYIHTIPRERILDHVKDNQSGSFSSDQIRKVCRDEDLDYVVLPNIDIKGDVIVFHYKIFEGDKKQKLVSENSFVRDYPLEISTDDLFDPISNWIRSSVKLSRSQIESDNDQELRLIVTDSFEALDYYGDAKLLFSDGNYDECIDLLQKALEEDPAFAMAYALMGYAYVYLQDPDHGLSCLKKAFDLKDRLSIYERMLIEGRYYNLNSQFAKAASTFEDLLKKNRTYEEAYIDLGSLYRNIEEWKKAERCFEQLLDLNHSVDTAYTNIDRSLQAQGLYHEARQFMRENRAFYKPESRYQLRVAMSFFYEGNIDRALQELNDVLPSIKNQPEKYFYVGFLNAGVGRSREAESAFNMFSESYPEFGLYNLALLDFLEGKYTNCRQKLNEGLLMTRDSGSVYDESSSLLTRAFLSMRTGDWNEAMADLKTGIELAVRYNNFYDEIFQRHMEGLVQLHFGRLEEAKNTLIKIRERVNRSGYLKLMRHALHLEGMIERKEGHRVEAKKLFKQAVDLLSKQRDFYDEHAFFLEPLALLCHENKEHREAEQYAKKILNLTSGRVLWGDIWPLTLFRLGKLSLEIGKKEQARDYLTRFLDMWAEADSGTPQVSEAEKLLLSIKNP
ncbi:MAG: protein kinase [Candidatus Aminicenantes bacterium]|nr:protein kinase [Candidatus Aminicenantes bacterium]